MLKTYCYAITFLLSAFSLPALSQKSATTLHRCDDRPEKTEIIITTQQNEVNIITKFSSRQLNTKSSSFYAGDYVVGLTALESITQMDFDGPVWQDEETGGECFAPRIEISLHYSPIQVFIGSEFKPGSCSYGAILKHENQHVLLYKENLPRIQHILHELMEKRFAGKALYAPKGTAKKMLEHEIDTLWRPLIKSEFAKIQIDQNQLDSDEGLATVSWACLGEVQRILGFRY